MSLFTVALFVHVSGAIGACVSLGIWLFGLAALRRARLVEQVRALAWLIVIASPLMVLSVVLLGLAGFEMALSTWGLSTPWIAVSLVSVVLIGPIGAFVLDPRMRTILGSAQEVPSGTLPDALILRTHDPILMASASSLATLLLGIVFLMTTKPQLFTSAYNSDPPISGTHQETFPIALIQTQPREMLGRPPSAHAKTCARTLACGKNDEHPCTGSREGGRETLFAGGRGNACPRALPAS